MYSWYAGVHIHGMRVFRHMRASQGKVTPALHRLQYMYLAHQKVQCSGLLVGAKYGGDLVCPELLR